MYARIAVLVFVWITAAFPASAGSNITMMSNPSQPIEGTRTVHPIEVWRGGADDAIVYFGLIAQVMAKSSGNILALDHIQSCIFEFGSDGEFIAKQDLLGEGPGELHGPVQLFGLVGGGLGIVQMFPGKIELIAEDGAYLNTIRLQESPTDGLLISYLYDAMPYGKDYLVVAEQIAELNGIRSRNNYVSIIDNEGREKKRLFEVKRSQDWAHFVMDENEVHHVHYRQVAVRQDGVVFVPTTRNGYEITGFGGDGETRYIISREYSPRKRTKAERRCVAALSEKQATGTTNPRIKISLTDPDIEMLRISDTGELWVTTSRSYSTGVPGVFSRIDVFDENGSFVRQDDIVIPDEHPSGRLLWLSDSRCVLVTGLKDALDEFQMAMLGVTENPREMYTLPMEIVVYDIDDPDAK